MVKKALITGITGQDGSYLAEFLLDKEYEVYGLERRVSSKNRENIKHLENKIKILSGDLLDQGSLIKVIQDVQPDELYNLASQSFVGESWSQPVYTGDVTGLGVLRMLEAVRAINPAIKFYQASSSEMFGKVEESPQNESTPFHPRSPYGAAKVYGHWVTVNSRESYRMFACSGILFNHESPRRGPEFVSRKITDAVARIKKGSGGKLYLGNPEAKRDWGFAGDYVEAMWKILQQKNPEDFVIATGENHSVQEFVEEAFSYAGLDWKNWVVFNDSRFIRPAEVDLLVGDYSKAKEILGWEPKVKFEELVKMMVDADIKLIS